MLIVAVGVLDAAADSLVDDGRWEACVFNRTPRLIMPHAPALP